ncbi:hypothetical protein HHK36_013476 [Tetracentron sinense]|uniref:DUF7796 domain-containing protein n=1 Tax=Tetracentron sinense TaxID=13715 RepID=A0A834Z657_TETSI|nr:hypothetical protein HHK36_013476 [Tetracentron sinense]
MKIDGIRSEIRETYGIETSKWQLYRARVKARDEIEGNHGKSYNKMPVYAEVVRETNSSSLVKIEYDRLNLNVNPKFKRFFICFEAMKNGFLEGCRPFIGLDGCHLKGPYGGVLLAAIALDGNNGLFPVAFAIVEGETKESRLREERDSSALRRSCRLEERLEKIFDRVAGKKLASVRKRVGKLALTGCVQDFEDMKKRTVIWDSPPAADICRLGLGSR